MALVVKDRVKVYSSTTGTGTLSLGSAFAGFQTFNNALGDGDTTYYGIFESSTGEWEVGLGTYTSSGNTLSRDTILESSNAGAAVNLTADTEVFITYPAEKSVYFDANGDVNLNRDPQSALQAATKQYVDTIAAAGIHYHDPVRVESPDTAGSLTATYDNGSSGVGATLTNSGTQAALVIDGVTVSTNDRVLIYNQTNGYENGVYTVTNTGSASTNWVLTRATDADSYGPSDPDSLGQGDAFFVKEGDTGAGELYVMNTAGEIVFGTTDINFIVVAETAVYSAGDGLTLSGTEFNVGAGTGITVNATTVSTVQDIATSATPTFDGLTTTGNITFGDNDKAIFGAGSDLQIYHDGSNSYIDDAGTGSLWVRGNDVILGKYTGEYYLYANADGALNLYYDHSKKLATTSTGVDITGTLTSDGLTTSGDILLAKSGATFIYNSVSGTDSLRLGGAAGIKLETFSGAWVDRIDIASNGDISFYEDTGTTAKFFWDASAEYLGIGTSSPSALIALARSSNFPFIHWNDSSNNTIAFAGWHGGTGGGDDFRIGTQATKAFSFHTNNAEAMRIDTSGNVIINGTVEGYTGYADTLTVSNTAGNGGMTIRSANTAVGSIFFSDVNANSGSDAYVGYLQYQHPADAMLFGTSSTEAMRIDSDGVLLIGKTSDVYSTEGTAIRGTTVGSKVTITRDGHNVLAMNRLSSDGDIVNIARSGTLMGSITTEGSGTGLIFKARATNGYIGFHANNQTEGIFLDDVTTKRLAPYSSRDNEFDLGDSDRRWKDLYLSGSLSDGTTSRTVSDIVGLTSSQFLRSDTSDTFSGATLTFNSGTARFLEYTGSSTGPYIQLTTNGTDNGYLQATSAGNVYLWNSRNNTGLNIDSNFQWYNGSSYETIWRSGNDGSGSGLDADTVDGLQASSFLRSDADDTTSGNLTIDKNTPRIDFKADQSGSNVGGRIELNENGNLWLNAQGGKDLWLNWLAPTSAGSYADLNVGDGNGGSYILRVEGSSRAVTINGNTVWTAGNDGSGSGLDADTVDGLQASSFLRSDADDTASGSYSFTNSYNEFGNSTGSVSNDGNWNARLNLAGSGHARLDVKSVSDGIITTMYSHTGQGVGKVGTYSNHPLVLMTNAASSATLSTSGSLSTTAQGTLWGSSNDGSGSGLDADLLDGNQAADFQYRKEVGFNVAGDADKFYKVSIPVSQDGDHLKVYRRYNWGIGGSSSYWNGGSTTHFGALMLDIKVLTNQWGGQREYICGNLAHNYTVVAGRAHMGVGSEFPNVIVYLRGGAGGSGAYYQYELESGSASAPTIDYNTYITSADTEFNNAYANNVINDAVARIYRNTSIVYDAGNEPQLGYVDVATGNYGTIKIDDDRGVTWAGYAIRDDWVFMSNGSGEAGIYNDTDNEWGIYFAQNAATYLYYNGSYKFETTSGGVAVSGALTATSDITAYFSDERLKDFDGKIEGALDKVSQLNGYYYHENDKAKELGFENDARQVGVSAQEVEAVLPEVIKPAPVDPEYKTVQYEKLVPLLIEAIKELKEEVRQLKEDKA